MPQRRPLIAVTLLPLLALAACGAPTDGGGAQPGSPAGPGTSVSSPPAECHKSRLDVTHPGRLTIGTDKPAYEPWFVGDDPSTGKGYESAVAYAIADQLGFEKSEVTWVDVPFNTAISPGPKDFDLDLNQISISDERRKAVDFSTGYYTVRQAVVTYKGSPIEGRTTVRDLAEARLGAQVGTTSYTAITSQIEPTTAPNAYDTNDLAVQALKNHQIDGLVVDLPTAFFMTGAQLEDGVILGQLPQPGGRPEQFGAVLDKGSSLTACISQAVDALREEGTLADLEQTWLKDQGAPELQ